MVRVQAVGLLLAVAGALAVGTEQRSAQTGLFVSSGRDVVASHPEAVPSVGGTRLAGQGVKSGDAEKPRYFRHRLRVCNAYPSGDALEVELEGKRLGGGKPFIPYQGCRDYTKQLRAGDRLDFRVMETSDDASGAFSVAEFPSSDALLLVVVSRLEMQSTQLSVDTHIFAETGKTEIAVIDAYRGKLQSQLVILDHDTAKTARIEVLVPGSVVAVHPGRYACGKKAPEKEAGVRTMADLVAVGGEVYVVIRTGIEAERGDVYPEELVVYPHSSAEDLRDRHSAACGHAVSLVALVASLLCIQAN